MISLIAAMSHHRVIGYRGQMPWHLPAELAYFKKLTLGKPVLMGRRTFCSLGKPLPNRRNLVLTQQPDLHLPGCEIFHSLAAVQAVAATTAELMVIGGATLYEQTLPLAHRLYLTFIDAELDGDTYFPEWDSTQWREVSRTEHAAEAKNRWAFTMVIFHRLL